jgi:peptidoglycan hydrolase-like protein with peptidoglycan-binding domain
MGHHRTQHRLRWTLCALVAGAFAAPLVGAAPARAARVHGPPAHVLHVGSHGPLVRRLQRLIGVRADGLFGPHTRHAVERFQRRHHLAVSGRVGRRTWGALTRRHAAPAHVRILQLGSTGWAVATVQRILVLPETRRYDRRTWRVVRAFQRRSGLHVDGEVGPHTWRALHRSERLRLATGVLHLGDRAPRVAAVQRRLGIRVNSLFDRRTWRAVRRFQRQHGLVVDGLVGPMTERALRHVSGHIRPHRHGPAPLGERAVDMARRYIGIRYRWGGTTPRHGFDCSGFVQYVYGRLGVGLPRVTYAQWHAGRHVRRHNLRPGDLVFFDHLGHVGIYTGHGWFLHAPRTGQRVHASRLGSRWARRRYDGAVRIS